MSAVFKPKQGLMSFKKLCKYRLSICFTADMGYCRNEFNAIFQVILYFLKYFVKYKSGQYHSVEHIHLSDNIHFVLNKQTVKLILT